MKAKQPLALRTLYTIRSSPPKFGVSRHHRENNDWLKNKKADTPVSTLVETRQKHAGTVHSQIWGGVGGFRSKGSIYPSARRYSELRPVWSEAETLSTNNTSLHALSNSLHPLIHPGFWR
jgi:hypothetical protein